MMNEKSCPTPRCVTDFCEFGQEPRLLIPPQTFILMFAVVNIGSLGRLKKVKNKIGYLVFCVHNIYDMLVYFNVQCFSLP